MADIAQPKPVLNMELQSNSDSCGQITEQPKPQQQMSLRGGGTGEEVCCGCCAACCACEAFECFECCKGMCDG